MCRVSCWYLVGSTGYVNCRVAVLRVFSLCAFVVSRVSWCCFASWCSVLCVVALGVGWGWVAPCCVAWCRVMWCGGVSCGGPLWCVALWFVALCCIVVRWLNLVVFVLRRCFVACFVALFVVAWFFSGVLLCWFVSCASLLRRVAPCYIMCCCVLPRCCMVLVLCRGVPCVVVSCFVVVRWAVCWCVALGIVTRCCVLLLGGWLYCVAFCVIVYRCSVVGFGVVCLVGGFVVLSCVSVLRGVV